MAGEFAGLLAVSDPIKASTPEAVATLTQRGLHVVMLSGDAETTARHVASQLGLSEVVADLLPQEKRDRIAKLQAEGHVVAMAGDGVNESAGVPLVEGDLRALARAHQLSRNTLSNIRQNLAFAFGYNALGIPLAAGLLYPFLGIVLSPMLAAAAMSLSSVSVITNALGLRRTSLS